MNKFYIHTPTGQIVRIEEELLKILLRNGYIPLRDFVICRVASPREQEAVKAFEKLVEVYGVLKP